MSGDLAFVAAAYGVILGGVGVYVITLVRRLRRASREAGDLPSNPHPPADPGA
jgi:hypothetical protein